MLLDERERRLGRLSVALDRRRLAAADVAAVAELDLDDVVPVARLPRDDEGLRQPEPDDVGADLHRGRLLSARAAASANANAGELVHPRRAPAHRSRPWDE